MFCQAREFTQIGRFAFYYDQKSVKGYVQPLQRTTLFLKPLAIGDVSLKSSFEGLHMQSLFPNALVLCLDEFPTFFRLYPSHKCVTSIICQAREFTQIFLLQA